MDGSRGNFQDIRELARFVTSLWGALAALSILLPWVNSWLEFVPHHPTMPSIAFALALFATIFAFLYTYVEGEEEGAYVDDPTGYRRRAPTPSQPSLRNAFGRFAWAVIALTLYLTLLALYAFLGTAVEGPIGAVRAALVPLMLVSYAALFGFLTAAVGSLAVVHWINTFRNRGHLEAEYRAAVREDDEATGIFRFPDGEERAVASDLRVDQAH